MQKLLSVIPSVDKLIKQLAGIALIQQYGHQAFVAQARQVIDSLRQHILTHQSLPVDQPADNLLSLIATNLQQTQQIAMKKVFNLTGTILHTNLGRAIWSEAAITAASDAMRHHSALEFDIEAGKRSHRDNTISQLLCEITGAEAACVVNNNAAAVLLMLATFAKGKEVIVSRGELVEIGGAFRIPDIMQQAGCKLVEVGTTNRTHLKDYRAAINENTALLMKVHTSNYQIQGFTHSVSEQQLVELGQEVGLPVMSDLGSGSLIDMATFGLPAEPLVQQKVASGVALVTFSADKLLGGPQAGIIVGKKADIEALQAHPLKRVLRCDKVILAGLGVALVTFSADKLLGGPQAGIIVGKKADIEALQAHPLKRVLRCDKVILAGLEATLRHYLLPDQLTTHLPTLSLLTQSIDHLRVKATRLQNSLSKRLDARYHLQIEQSLAQIGSGALPTERLASLAVTITAPTQRDLLQLEQQFKMLKYPIIGRFAEQKLWLDLRSVAQFDQLIEMLEEK
ncbi:selenocysteine synthase [[Haemophilus] ducreyi]|uniref:L-seryl-tRNA(Sec) selenium transferase n=1 Tax=Haemophilus ducreyi TaxID=730 RepID=UPI00065577B0|nr:L-seryl-tRNA(Sec) selenium transferase [[Haemophilus] ducreyi]AKO41936.1 selenocysteine synthase [[Haemophilus] ducreyi]